jgi:PAS domain S-box-containing protein
VTGAGPIIGDEGTVGEFALIADAAPVPMWVTRPDGKRGFVNRAYCAFVGADYTTALLIDWREGLHREDADRVRAETEAGLATGATFSVEARYRRADGEWRWLRSVSQPRLDTIGERGGYIGVAHDITEAKVAEQEVRARERQLSALIDQTSAGLAQTDLTGRFTLVNDRFCTITGRSRDELMQLTMQAITHPDDLPRNLPLFEAAVRDGTPFAHEKRYLCPQGGVVWVSNSVSAIRGPDGAPYGVLAVTLDITARHEAEAAVQENQARLEFLDTLGRATATATDADQVLAITTRLLGQHLGASDCAYADVEPDGDTFHIRGDWNAPGAPSIVGTYSLATFGSQAVADMFAGRPLIITDIADIEGDGAAAFRAIGIQATICMPFIKGDRFAAMMAVHDMKPREWSDPELSLVREVTERSWAHVERVRAEAALRDSERQLRLAVEGARIGTWEQDLRTGRGRWSPRAAEIMGVPHDRPLSPEQRIALIHPDDREWMARGTARLTRSGDDFAIEHRVIRPDGALRWVASHGVVIRDENGVAVHTLGTVRDVTERRQAQEALKALNQTLEQQVAERTAERDRMWRLSRDLLLVIDTRRRIRAVNPAIASLGYAEAEVLGRRLTSFIHPDDLAISTAAIRAAAQRSIGEFTARLLASDGSARRFAWSAAPGEGEAYVIGRDVTAETERRDELAQAQEALRQAQKVESLGQLTGGVAHDFNNLLTPIIGNLDLLGRRAGEDERQARLIRGALESAERARTLVQRLLAFARRQPLQPGPVNLAALLGDMVTLVASTVGPQVEVFTEFAPDLPFAFVDANQLELAILNLAVNARDAMPDGGRLRLIAAATDASVAEAAGLIGRYVTLSVGDTGTGMDAGTAARAIEPFFSTKGVGKGTGLGLSMVHGLASQLGGAMRIETAPGQGTRIELLLPVAPEGPTEPREDMAAAGVLTGRVLLVDDETPVRDATAAILRDLGLSVTTAGSGEEALLMLSDRPDYLVTDHLMPGMTGADLARRARMERPELKVLVVSGYAALDAIPPDLPRLAKPFRVDELAASLGALG